MTRSVKAVALVLFTTLLVAAAVIAPASAQEETAQADASEFVPCQGKGDGGVDILFMMDQSGSLNGAGGAVVRFDDLTPLAYGKEDFANPFFISASRDGVARLIKDQESAGR